MGLEAREPSGVRLVMLGTGTPYADPDRAGPSLAVVVDGEPYVVDAGAGVVRRAAAAGIDVRRLRRVLVTHLHSDHTVGLPDLLLSPWVVGREEPLDVLGPPGIEEMVAHVRAAWAEDVRVRTEGLEEASGTGHEAIVRVVEPGVVHDEGGVRVTAFAVPHGSWEHAFGYRFDARDRSIVVSGDAGPSRAVALACDGCDVLVHEVYSRAGWERLPSGPQRYHATFHTSGVELGELAEAARAKTLVLTHVLPFGEDAASIVEEVRRAYGGEIVVAEDLDVL